MNTKDFRYRAIAWLRDQMNVETHCLPHDDIEEDDGTAIVDGEVVRASKANPWRGQGLIFFAMSYGIGLAASQGMAPGLRLMLGITSGFFAVGALFSLVAAFLYGRGRRSHVLVEIHPEHEPVGEARIRSFRRKAKHGDAWIVSAAGFTPDAVARANELAVRCFGYDDRFIETKPQLLAA